MDQATNGSSDDLSDTNFFQFGNHVFIRESTEGPWIALGDAIVDGQYSFDADLVDSSNGQNTTTTPSQVPSETDPTSISDPYSATDLGAQRQSPKEEQPLVDSLQPHDLLLRGIGQGYPMEYPQDLPMNLKASGGENAINQASPSSTPVRQEPISQTAPAQGSMGIPRQEVDTTLDLPYLEENVMWVLAQNPSHERLLQTSKRLGVVWNQVIAHLNALGNEEMPPPPPPLANESGDNEEKEIDRTRPYYKCCICGMETPTLHVIKRHAADKHFPEYEYYCHHDDGHCTLLREPPRRRDKILDHYRMHHGGVPVGNIINQKRVPLPCESVCKFCPRNVQTWKQFYACFAEHCFVKPASSNIGSSQRDDNDRANKKRKNGPDHDTLGGGAGAAGPASSQQGYGHSGYATGQGQHHFTSGTSRNQMSNVDSRPLLQDRSASDPSNGRTKGPHLKATHPPKSKPRASGSGGGSGGVTKGLPKKKSSKPRVDPRKSQDQTSSQPPVDKCKSCPHIFGTCLQCCNAPPSGNWCHECPNMRAAQSMQAGTLNVNRASGVSPINSQPMGFPQHAQYNPQGLHGARSSIPMVPRGSPTYAAIQQQLLRQRAQAQGMGPRMNTQQGFFGGNSSYMTNAVHDVQVRGMSELEMETSIIGSKSKFDPKKTTCSNILSVVLPFRGSPPPLRKSLMGMTSIPASAMGMITRQFIGPVPLTKVNPSMCQCACRTKSQGTYFARGRMDMAGGRRIELDFKMAPEARGTGHPLRTRIQVVVKMLRLRSSATRSASAKHKQEAHDAIKKALEATLDGSETKTIPCEDEAKVAELGSSDYDSDVESVTDSIFSSCSRVSSCTDFAQLSSPPSSPPALTFSRTSSFTDLTLASPHCSPELSACPKKSSCTDLELPGLSLPFRQKWNDDTLSSEEHSVHDLEAYEEEEKELELTFDLDLKSSLDMLARWTGVPTDDLRSSVSVWDPDRVFKYIMNHLLFVIFSLARSGGNDPNPCWDKKRPSHS
ncbi:uncharacterized protein N7473_009361 [Penicillium subrubescens]|uniref:uncharacterized protein n=1 Tax=Penicillium subrubescens TaxID=1316194 RepID=UPI002545508A|nr:uncharacterized protein N7473_009361 [Penicillium subrubescens]KAJ5886687.1 hypothetical protein N7473_009361 [Penicillium subrubescens]